MAYPEKVTYNQKYNLRPILEPNGQFSAEDANHLKEKVNKNALFHDVHDDLAAVQAAFPNPPKGAFAYLRSGGCARCLGTGWTLDNGGGSGESSYFYGYHFSLSALKAAHPIAKPGARAVLRVINGNDQEALWDEDAQDWFAFQISYGGGNTGGSSVVQTKIIQFDAIHISGLKYQLIANWIFNGITYQKTEAERELPAPDPTYSKIYLFALNDVGDIVIKEVANPSENLQSPTVDPITEISTGVFVIVEANATEPNDVSAQVIYAENAQVAGGEWNTSTLDNTINLASNADPYSGAVAIEGSNLKKYEAFELIPDAPVATADFEGLTYRFKQKSTDLLTTLTILGYYTGTDGFTHSEYLTVKSFTPGSIAWQLIAAGINKDYPYLEKLRFINHNPNSAGFGFFVDEIKLVSSGSGNISPEFATKQFVETKADETLQAAKDYADSLVVGGADHVHDSYNTIADMIAAQAGQVDGEYFLVIDASTDNTVDAGWALYEYLGSTLGTLDDYRKLSEEESLDVIYYDYSQDIADIQAEVDALEVRVADLETRKIKVVSASRDFTDEDHDYTLLITAAVTLTYPAIGTLRADFGCEIDTDAAGTVAIGGDSTVLDNLVGATIAENSMATLQARPDNQKLRGKGEITLP